MLAPFWLAFRSFTSNRLRTLTVLGSVLLGVAGLSAVLLTNDAMSRGIERAWRTTVGVSHLQLRSFSGSGFGEATLDRVRAIPEVVAAAPTTRKWAFYRIPPEQARGQQIGIDRGFVEIIGVDPAAEPRIRSYQVQGQFVSDADPASVVVREAWAEERGLRLGDSLDLITREGLQPFKIVGLLVADQAGVATYGSAVLVSMRAARQAFGMEDRVGSISLLLTSEQAAPSVQAALSRAVEEPYTLRRSEDVRADLERSISELQAGLVLFGATALFVALFLILNTLEMTVADQMQQTGRVRAAGATQRQVFVYFLIQGLVPGGAGAVLGAALAYGLAAGLAAWISATQDVSVAPILFSAPITALSVLAGLFAVTGAALSPSLRAARANPIEMVQVEETEVGQVSWRGVGLGIVLLAVGAFGLAAPISPQLARPMQALGLFALLAGLVLVSAVVVKPLSPLVALPFKTFASSPERLAARNLARHTNRTALTVSGFMISLSLLVALASVAAGSLRAGERWTRSLIPANYVVVSPVDQAPVFVPEFAKLPGVGLASPVGFWLSQSDGWLVQLASVEPALFVAGLEFVEGSAADARARMEGGGGLLVPARLAKERGIKVGDTLPLQAATGTTPFRVAGIIAHSFPSPDGARTVLVSRADAERLFNQTTFRLLMVRTADPQSAGPLRQVYKEKGEPYGASDDGMWRYFREKVLADTAELFGMSATSAREIADQVAKAIWNLVALLGALVAIGLLFGAFGTANTMLMNVTERARELNVLWAAGMSRSQLQLMTMAEATMMGLIGGLLGVAVGALLARILVNLSRTSGFEPEFVFSWEIAAIGIAITVVASAVAAIGPARRAGLVDFR